MTLTFNNGGSVGRNGDGAGTTGGGSNGNSNSGHDNSGRGSGNNNRGSSNTSSLKYLVAIITVIACKQLAVLKKLETSTYITHYYQSKRYLEGITFEEPQPQSKNQEEKSREGNLRRSSSQQQTQITLSSMSLEERKHQKELFKQQKRQGMFHNPNDGLRSSPQSKFVAKDDVYVNSHFMKPVVDTNNSNNTTTMLWPNPDLLRSVADDNNDIIVIAVNCGYVTIGQNWILHVRKLNVTNYVVIALDERVYPILHEFDPHHVIPLEVSYSYSSPDKQQQQHGNTHNNPHQIQRQHHHHHHSNHPNIHMKLENDHLTVNRTKDTTTNDESLSESSSSSQQPLQQQQQKQQQPLLDDGGQWFNTPGFFKICKQRPYMIQSILNQGYNVLYSDIDLVFNKNPLERIHEVFPDKDYVGITDTDVDDPTIVDYVCSALLYFKANVRGIEMMIRYWNMRMQVDVSDYGHDQHHLRSALKRFHGMYTYGLLSKWEFPPGFMFFNVPAEDATTIKPYANITKDNVYTVHANWMSGYWNKIRHFKEKEFWLVRDDDGKRNDQNSSSSSEFDSLTCITKEKEQEGKREPVVR